MYNQCASRMECLVVIESNKCCSMGIFFKNNKCKSLLGTSKHF